MSLVMAIEIHKSRLTTSYIILINFNYLAAYMSARMKG